MSACLQGVDKGKEKQEGGKEKMLSKEEFKLNSIRFVYITFQFQRLLLAFPKIGFFFMSKKVYETFRNLFSLLLTYVVPGSVSGGAKNGRISNTFCINTML